MNNATIIALALMGVMAGAGLIAAGALIEIAHHLRRISRRYGLDS